MPTRATNTPGQVVAPSLLFGTMALGLAFGLDILGFWSSLDDSVTAWMDRLGDDMSDVPSGYLIMLTIFSAYLLPLLMLSSPHWWRRFILWLSLLLITIAWLPVLALAQWKLRPCVPVVALCWSGLCAFIYGLNHLLPCEQMTKKTATPSPQPAETE
jgi:hypothetical protein